MNGSIEEELKNILIQKGAKLVGFADLKEAKGTRFNFGISVAVTVPKYIVCGIENGPTKEYYEMYNILNDKLNAIVKAGACYLADRGYEAFAQTTDAVKQNEEWRTPLPHKTVASMAGLGWIGKSCLLVTPKYGSAVRISSLLTNAPLKCGEPITESKCNKCSKCVDACPAKALKGTAWFAGMEREELFIKEKCYEKQIELMKERTGIETDLCGKCFVVCPYTRRYIKE